MNRDGDYGMIIAFDSPKYTDSVEFTVSSDATRNNIGAKVEVFMGN